MAQELKAFGIRGEENGRLYFAEVYTKRDVDAVLTEKDMEIFDLKKELFYIKEDSTFDRDKHKDLLKSKDEEICRLQRALWLMRAERAKERKFHFDTLDYLGISAVTINFESARTWMTCKTEEPSKWAIIFEKVEQKCRVKAEQYK